MRFSDSCYFFKRYEKQLTCKKKSTITEWYEDYEAGFSNRGYRKVHPGEKYGVPVNKCPCNTRYLAGHDSFSHCLLSDIPYQYYPVFIHIIGRQSQRFFTSTLDAFHFTCLQLTTISGIVPHNRIFIFVIF